MNSIAQAISENWQRVVADVVETCRRANRDPREVTIVGASKYVGPEVASHLVEAGCTVLGENRPQQLWEKHAWFAARSQSVEFHFIGHLQRNKVRRTLPCIGCLHSLDSLRLAEAVSQEAVASQRGIRCLIDVNMTQDSTKTGLPAEELDGIIEHILNLPGIQLCGLMAMSSLDSSGDAARGEFSLVRELRDSLAKKFSLQDSLRELSMGMSGDFRQAIMEGATMVRIGSSLWQGVQEPS